MMVQFLRQKILDRSPRWLQIVVMILYRHFPSGLRYVLNFPFRRHFINRDKYAKVFLKKYEKYTLKPFVEVKEGDIVVDVGAHTGRFVFSVAGKAKKILAIEPDPVNCETLRRNVGCLQNTLVVEKLAWNRKCMKELNFGVDLTDSSVLDIDKTSLGLSKKVQGVPLDCLVSKLGIEKVNFLKIDAEGAEPEVLQGAKRILKEIEKVAIDTGPERFGRPTSSQVKNILKHYGFKIYVNENNIVYGWR